MHGEHSLFVHPINHSKLIWKPPFVKHIHSNLDKQLLQNQLPRAIKQRHNLLLFLVVYRIHHHHLLEFEQESEDSVTINRVQSSQDLEVGVNQSMSILYKPLQCHLLLLQQNRVLPELLLLLLPLLLLLLLLLHCKHQPLHNL